MKEKLLKAAAILLFGTGIFCTLGTTAYFSDFAEKINNIAAVGSVIYGN